MRKSYSVTIKKLISLALIICMIWISLSMPIVVKGETVSVNDAVNMNGKFYWNKDGDNFNASFTWSPSMLVKYNNKTYHKDLSELSSALATAAYANAGDKADMNGSNIIFDKDIYGNPTHYTRGSTTGAFKALGFKDCIYLDINASNYGSKPNEDVDDVTSIVLGHTTVEDNGKNADVFVCAVRGTNGTEQEWKSNFDIGADTADYYGLRSADWVNHDDHKGFNVAATRALRAIDQYINKYSEDNNGKTYVLTTGHSRGAAIANILGKTFEDRNNVVPFTYTFAAPSTTTASNRNNYNTIFNIINKDDFVTMMPLTEWGFGHYGVDCTRSIDENNELEKIVEKRADWYDYHCAMKSSIKGLKTLITNKYKANINNRKEVYSVYNKGAAYTLYANSKNHADKRKQKLVDWGFDKYCRIEYVDGFLWGTNIKVKPTMGFLFQELAYVAAKGGVGSLNYTPSEVEIDRVYFEIKAQFAMIGAGYSMKDPHYMVSYYTLVHDGNVGDFHSVSGSW